MIFNNAVCSSFCPNIYVDTKVQTLFCKKNILNVVNRPSITTIQFAAFLSKSTVTASIMRTFLISMADLLNIKSLEPAVWFIIAKSAVIPEFHKVTANLTPRAAHTRDSNSALIRIFCCAYQ